MIMTNQAPTPENAAPAAVMVHQALMDQAYARYQRSWSPDTFLAQLDRANGEYATVLLGNMNYQVGNGGWSQWVGNGYGNAVAYREILNILKLMGTPAAATVAKILCGVGQFWGRFAWDDSAICDEVWEDQQQRNDQLSGAYYAVSIAFMTEVEVWLSLRWNAWCSLVVVR